MAVTGSEIADLSSHGGCGRHDWPRFFRSDIDPCAFLMRGVRSYWRKQFGEWVAAEDVQVALWFRNVSAIGLRVCASPLRCSQNRELTAVSEGVDDRHKLVPACAAVRPRSFPQCSHIDNWIPSPNVRGMLSNTMALRLIRAGQEGDFATSPRLRKKATRNH